MVKGRPRDPRADAAILAAALELLAASGYAKLSIEAVAKRASVSRPTVYLRWPSKAQLVHEAVFPAGELPVPSHGAFAQDVRAMVSSAIAYLGRPEVLAAAPGLMAEFAADPPLRALIASRLEDHVRAVLRERVESAAASGEIRPDADADLLLDVIVGTVLFSLLLRTDNPGFADAFTELLLRGLA